MKEGNMIDVAREILEKEGCELKFADLWAKVKETLDISPEEEADRIGHFYTDLFLCGSIFVMLDDNKWDLRSRHKFAEVKREIPIAYTELEANEEDPEDAKENAEYEQFVNSGSYFDSNNLDTGATDGEGLEDTGKEVSTNDYISGANHIGEDY